MVHCTLSLLISMVCSHSAQGTDCVLYILCITTRIVCVVYRYSLVLVP